MEKTNVNNPYGPPIWPRFEELEGILQKWAQKHADLMKLEVRGKSLEGRPVYAVRLTHSDAEDSKKEHALITCLHSGVERSATLAAFYILEWFLSGDPIAANILTRQIVVIMPVPNPDCYEKGEHGWTYTEWNFDGPNHPDKMPEAVAVQQVIDEFQPEVHADIHGLSMDFEKYIMLENSGSAYSNFALRSYHHEIIRQMDAAALEEGYPSDHQESDSERMFWGPELDFMSEKLCVGRPRFYAATYCYYHYHTILSAVEVSWERSAFLRHRRLLQIGNEQWPGEYYPGYPCRIILSNYYHQVVAYGPTAAERRKSRVELWNKVGQLSLGQADPVVEGKILLVAATSPRANQQWCKGKTMKVFTENLVNNPLINEQPIQQFTEAWPSGQNAPDARLHFFEGNAGIEESSPIEHGLSLRLRIPYLKARVVDLKLNGKPLSHSASDGWLQFNARGYTYIQINIPPDKSKHEDLFVVTCQYHPGEQRSHWQGWLSPGNL